MKRSDMLSRTLFSVGLLLPFASCAGGDDPNPSGDGGAGETTTGGSSAGSGRGGSANGGTTEGGDAGDDHGGSSGTSQGGASGTGEGGSGAGQDGSAGDGVAAAGGRDDGAGTVTGFVRNHSGAPNPNVLVSIGPTTTYTDADGRFEVADVAPEYDLVLIVPQERYALVIRGASTRSPRLTAPGNSFVGSVSVTGVVTGGAGAPLPEDCQALVMYDGSTIHPSAVFGQPTVLNQSDANYWLDLFWFNATSASGSLYAIEYRFDAMGRTVAYDGFGSTPLHLDHGGMYGAPATTIALAPVASRTVSGTIIGPPGYAFGLTFSVGPFATDSVGGSPQTYSAVLPTGIAGMPNTVRVGAEPEGTNSYEGSSATYLVDDSVTTLDLSIPEVTKVLSPALGAIGVDYGTQFSWEPGESVSMIQFAIGAWTTVVVTDASSATIPDLTEFGVSYQPGGGSSWSLWNHQEMTSADEWMELTADEAAYLQAHGTSVLTFTLGLTFALAE